MKITLVRHGQTHENASGIIQGHARGTLNDIGRLQARKLAARLKGEKFDLVFCSDLERARQTAEEIMRYHDSRIVYSEMIRERNMGTFEHKHRDAYYRARDESGLSAADFRPEGGESYHDVRERAKEFVEKLEEHKGKNILIISHGMINRTLIAELMGMSTEDSERIEQENACVNVIEISDNGSRIISLNDYSHLN